MLTYKTLNNSFNLVRVSVGYTNSPEGLYKRVFKICEESTEMSCIYNIGWNIVDTITGQLTMNSGEGCFVTVNYKIPAFAPDKNGIKRAISC